MKHILYISQKPFYPQTDGGTKAMHLFFQSAAACRDVQLTYMPICTKKHPDLGMPEGIKQFNYRPLTISTRLNLSKLLMLFFTRYPLNVIRYRERKARKILQDTITSHRFDIILCDGFYALSLIDFNRLQSEKVIYRSHNIESKYWFLKMSFSQSWRKIVFSSIYRRMVRYEPQLVRMANTVLCIASDEVKTTMDWNKNSQLFPPHIQEFTHKNTRNTESKTSSIGFVGDMNWMPNQLALQEFIQEIWPLVLEQNPGLHFHIAGKNSESYTDPKQSIVGHGFLSDLSLFYEVQLLIVNPVRHGTGFNMKIIESLMHGKTVVSYSDRLSGFSHYKCFSAVNTKDEFVEAISDLVQSPGFRKEKEDAIEEIIQLAFNVKDRIHQLEEIIHGS